MPWCPNCHVAAVAVAQSASAVRDLGFASAAVSVLGIGYKRRLFDAPAFHPAARDADANQIRLQASGPPDYPNTSALTKQEKTHAVLP